MGKMKEIKETVHVTNRPTVSLRALEEALEEDFGWFYEYFMVQAPCFIEWTVGQGSSDAWDLLESFGNSDKIDTVLELLSFTNGEVILIDTGDF